MATQQCQRVMKTDLNRDEKATLNELVKQAERQYNLPEVRQAIEEQQEALSAKAAREQPQEYGFRGLEMQHGQNDGRRLSRGGNYQACGSNDFHSARREDDGWGPPRNSGAQGARGPQRNYTVKNAKVGFPGIGTLIGIGGKLFAQYVASVSGTLRNQTKGNLYLNDQHKWCGALYVKSPPNVLDSFGVIVQTAIDEPCKAAVLYTGNNRAGNQCAWLFAWCNSKDSGRKVYVECGPRRNYNYIDWTNIESNLAKARSTHTCTDYSTGTKVSANIVGGLGQAAFGATFSG